MAYVMKPTYNGDEAKNDTDEWSPVFLTNETHNVDVLHCLTSCLGLRYPLEEVPVVVLKAAGVKATNLKDGDYVAAGALVPSDGDSPIYCSQRAPNACSLKNYRNLSRAKRGLMIFRE